MLGAWPDPREWTQGHGDADPGHLPLPRSAGSWGHSCDARRYVQRVEPHAHPLTRQANGDWATTVYLPPDRVVYCFYVDGVFWLDPEDDERVPNSWGSEYSVRHVRPELPSRPESA